MNIEKVKQEFQDIKEGAGWATDSYIDNFSSEHLNEDECYHLKILLAHHDMLFCEDRLSEDIEDPYQENPNEEAKMTIEEVISLK
jgi:hypothetical protein